MLKKIFVKIKKYKFTNFIIEFIRELNADKVDVYSAQAAFFIIISFFPFAMLVLTLLNFLPFSDEDFNNFTLNFLSPSVTEFVNSVIREISGKASGAVISVTTITALWSASRGLISIIGGFNSVYGITEKRSFIRINLTALLYVIVMIATLIATLGILVFGGSINAWLSERIPGFGNFTDLFIQLRWVMGLCVLTLFFMFLYTVAPERKTRFMSEFPGAFLSALGWLLYSALYSFYIENFGNYSYLYGSLTAAVLLMLWLYSCMYILFAGAELNDKIKRSGNP